MAPSATTPAAPAQSSTAEAAGPAQITQVVDSEFPTYDTDSSGTLSDKEFGSWIVALKTASDPATKADSAETKSWVKAAFAQADLDKSKSVSKSELASFLTKGSQPS